MDYAATVADENKKGHRQKRKTSEVIHQHSMTQAATVFCESKKNK